MKMKFDKDLDQNLSNSAADDYPDSEKHQLQNLGQRKQINGVDMWLPEQMLGKNENTPIAVMSNSTIHIQK